MATETENSCASWPEWTWFDSVERSLKSAVRKIQSSDSSELSALFPYFDSVLESNDSFRFLALQQRLRDSYVLARVIYETSLNGCFVLTDPRTLSLRASTHAKQKALRSVVRSIEVAGETVFKLEMQGSEEVLQHPEHRKWLEEFTTKSGREVSSWTSESVPQRLDAVYKKFGSADSRGLAFCLLVYRHASEIAHGTLFGTLFSWGAMEIGYPLKSSDDLAVFRNKELKHLIKLIAYSHESVVRILSVPLRDPGLAKEVVEARESYYKNRDVGD